MKITKFGHCCLLIELDNARILTDPGVYSSQQNNIKDLDIIIISHDHKDHLDMDSLKAIMKNNPSATIITNHSVGNLLEEQYIGYTVVEDGDNIIKKDVGIEGVGRNHPVIHHLLPMPQNENTAYLIDEKLFFPGDSLTLPKREVEILALPIDGPWLKLSEAIDYALDVKPKKCFPIHDGAMKDVSFTNTSIESVLKPKGIEYIDLPLNRLITL